MNHPEVRTRMGEYLQGDLDLAQRALFDAHLDGCEACAEELRGLRDTVDWLRDLPAPEVPQHLVDRVVAKIEDGEGRPRWWDGPVAFWNLIDPARYLPPLAAAALTSAAVIVGVRDLGWEIPGMRAPSVERLAEPALREAKPDLRMQRQALAPARERAATVSDAPRGGRAYMIRGLMGASVEPGEAARPSVEAEEDVREPELFRDPQLFLRQFRAVQADAQDDWLARMAARAARRSQVEAVARRLREDAGPEGRAVADRFEAVAYPAGR